LLAFLLTLDVLLESLVQFFLYLPQKKKKKKKGKKEGKSKGKGAPIMYPSHLLNP
jgi:hypothetical protein